MPIATLKYETALRSDASCWCGIEDIENWVLKPPCLPVILPFTHLPLGKMRFCLPKVIDNFAALLSKDSR